MIKEKLLANVPEIILRIFMKEQGSAHSGEATAEHRLWTVGTHVPYIPGINTLS